MKRSRSNVRTKQTLSYMLAGVLILGSYSTSAVSSSKVDPCEHINRKLFVFNTHLDNYVAAPISNAYKWITPQFVQTGVFNFYNNLKNINVIVNDVLQAKLKQSAQDTGRLVINSTLGLVGLVDVARDVGLEQNDEDFDQTLAVWGVPKGPYIVLPVLGPLTVRGIPGAIFDTAANPSSYVGAPVQLLSMLNTRANAEGALKFIDEAALDPYVFTRESFLQWRHSLATDGQSQMTSDFDDELLDDSETLSISPASKNNRSDLTLSLSEYIKKFEQASQSFSTTANAFDQIAKSYENVSEKLDKLKN